MQNQAQTHRASRAYLDQIIYITCNGYKRMSTTRPRMFGIMALKKGRNELLCFHSPISMSSFDIICNPTGDLSHLDTQIPVRRRTDFLPRMETQEARWYCVPRAWNVGAFGKIFGLRGDFGRLSSRECSAIDHRAHGFTA